METKGSFLFYNPQSGELRRHMARNSFCGFRWEADMREHHAIGLAACLLGATLISVTAPALAAKIKCQGIFQVMKHGLLSTPYCQDQEIARVARSYGWKVTVAQVRNDPLKKVYICQALGNDNRLKGACGAYSSRRYR
jgi:hypothetical protein